MKKKNYQNKNIKQQIKQVFFAVVFFFVMNASFVQAAIGDVGHFRDATGSQIPGTAFTPFNFSAEIRNDGIFSRPNNATIQFDEAGDYLVISTTQDADDSNGRYNPQTRMELIAGQGDVFTSHYSGYSRDNSENQSWTKTVGVVIGASVGAQIQIQKRRATDAPTGGSIINQSDLQVVQINPTNHGIYSIGGTGNVYGGTTPNLVDLTSIDSESDIASIEGSTATDTVTLKGNNKRYLVGWSVSGEGTNNQRTQRIGHLEYDGVDDLATRAYCYQRNTANRHCGLGSLDIIETDTADIDIQVEVFRGPGVDADQGGASINGTWTTNGLGEFFVIELSDTTEVFRSHDSVGLQSITTATTLAPVRDLDFNDANSFTKNSDALIDVADPSDIFTWGNIWTARSNVGSGGRQTSFASITLDGVEQSTGEHGNYSRGNQGNADTFAAGFYPGGIYTTAVAGVDLGINIDPLAGGENGGGDRTQPGTVGFLGINLDTLFVEPLLSQTAYRFFDNIDALDVGAALADQDLPATIQVDSSFRLRTLVEVADAPLTLEEADLKLQFAEKVGSCDVAFAGEVYSDVTNSSLIAFNDNPNTNDGDGLVANVADPVNGLSTIVNQEYRESNNFTNSVSPIDVGQSGKWDFSLVDNGVLADSSYCFRIVDAAGEELDSYVVIPEVIFVQQEEAPGGIVQELNLWLRADQDTLSDGGQPALEGDSLREWRDQSPGLFHATERVSGSGDNLIYEQNAFNFNPSINFNGGDQPLQNLNFLRDSGTSLSHFVVARSDSQLPLGNSFGEWTDNGASRAFFFNNRYASNTNYSLPLNELLILSLDDPGAFSPVTLYQNSLLNSVTAKDFNTNFTSGSYILGDDNTGGNIFDGNISEIIIYDRQLSNADRGNIESYLGIKYGITLDQSATGGGVIYTDSTGAVYWNEDVNDVYEHDIFGLGRDDTSELDQRISRSTNDDAIITASLGTDFLSANTDLSAHNISHVNDLQYLMFANNNEPTSPQGSELPGGFSERIAREWQVQKTSNFTQDINLKFDGFNSDYSLFVDVDGDFSTGSINLGSLNSDGEIFDVDLADAVFITLVKTLVPQELSYDVFDVDGDNRIGFDLLIPSGSRFATSDTDGSLAAAIAANITASTNAVNGYIIEIDGTNLVHMSDPSVVIDGIGSLPTASSVGTEQFGLRAEINGTGSIESPYNSLTDYGYDVSLFPDDFSVGVGDNSINNHDLEFIANISPITPAGEYQAVITYTMHAQF